MRIFQFLRATAVCLAASIAFSKAPEWRFVYVAALENEASIEQGTTRLEIKGSKFTAKIFVDGQEWGTLSGTIRSGHVEAKYTVLGSGYTINAPYSGSITRKTWNRQGNSIGRECIQLSDGFNSIILFHELTP